MRSALLLAATLIATVGCGERTIEAQPSDYVGVGVELTMEAAGARVVRILPGSAAGDVGLAPGDIILEVDGTLTRGRTLAEVVDRLRGQAGSEVAILARTPSGNRELGLLRRKLHNP